MMGVARDHLPEDRGAATIALISVVSVVGAGVGYPLAALLAEFGGLRAAYGLGLLVTALALVTAWRSVPAAPEGRSAHVNVAAALVLAGGLALVLFLAGGRSLWSRHLTVAVTLAVVAVLLLCVWTVSELRTRTPLVGVRAVRHPAVAGANIAMFVGGSGMYLLLTLVTRYAQTPQSAGYGFGLTTFVAGLVLVPFSVLGFVAGRITQRVRERIDGPCSWPAVPSSSAAGSCCSRPPGPTWPNCSRSWACSASASAASRPRCPASSWPSPRRARRRAR